MMFEPIIILYDWKIISTCLIYFYLISLNGLNVTFNFFVCYLSIKNLMNKFKIA